MIQDVCEEVSRLPQGWVGYCGLWEAALPRGVQHEVCDGGGDDGVWLAHDDDGDA